jgi:hypothetical protein
MPYARAGYQQPQQQSRGYSRKSGGRSIQPRVKLSLLGKAYNKVRWACYFLPILGFFIIGYGIYIALYHPMKDLIVSQTIIAGGGVMTYLAIYYNKRT